MDLTLLFYSFLALSTLVQVQGQTEDDDSDDFSCEPTIADSCFHDVADDLRFIFDPVNNYLQATNDSALNDLCNAWEDSLNCTSDIIDSSCRIEDGRLQFDAWNEGLKRVVEYLCTDNKNNLRAIADAVQCWSIVKFLQCVETEASLVSIAGLLQTALDREECNLLQNTIRICNTKASNPQCILSGIIVSTLSAGNDAFFNHVDCSNSRYPSPASLPSSAIQRTFKAFTTLAPLLLLVGLLST